MRFGKRAHAERMLEVDLAPMIDVTFLLIIFFMTTARFAEHTRADLSLPTELGEQQEAVEEAGLVINIDAAGRILVGDDTLDIDDLETLVQREVAQRADRDAQRLKLLIRADRTANTDRLNEVVTRLQKLGVGAARIATEVPR